MGLFSKKTEDPDALQRMYGDASESYRRGDYDGAFEAFRTLARKEHPEAMLCLAGMYEHGQGTMQDTEAALKWYSKCPLPMARFRQGCILFNDKGVLKDPEKGLALITEAAEQGNTEAIRMLGPMYESGDRVQRNPAEAFRLYKIGAQQGDPFCQYLLANACRRSIGTVRSPEDASVWMNKSAAAGCTEAECALGEMHSRGDCVPQSYTEAEKWYLRAAGKGDPGAQCQLAWNYQIGVLGQRDQDALKWHRAAAEQGNPVSMNNLGVMAESGRGSAASPYEAFGWYKKSASLGDPFGLFNAGRCHSEGIGVPKNDTEAVRNLLQAADKGNLPGLLLLSEFCSDGRGCDQNFDASRKWSKKALAPMNHSAQFTIGWYYEVGVQVPASVVESARWYGVAANNGSAPAQCNLGLRYEQGRGVDQSYTEAFKWYKKAADNGNSTAQYNVALLYDKGRGVPQDDQSAVQYYTRSAENGNVSAMCALGLMHESGRGVYQSEELAYKWYKAALDNGNREAEKHIRRLRGEEEEEEEMDGNSDTGNTGRVEAVTETFSKFRPVPDTGVDFSMVKGLDEVKQEVNHQILQPYRHPDVYRRFKKKVGGGILLYGPPGTGKTMIAQAIATETKAVFFSVKCSDILSRWTGEAVANIKKLFALARKQPRAVIFFDEFEALGRARADDSRSWEDSLMAELLSQIQGFDQYDSTLIILAATNRPWDIDTALLRSGRFSRHIFVPLPDEGSRRAIIESQFDGVPVDPSFDISDAVAHTAGFNGADVVEFCEQVKQSAINRCIARGSSDEKVTSEDSVFAKTRTKCSVDRENLERLESYREAGF